jgi:CubicO group peptidase (beta-lactamase class C family)
MTTLATDTAPELQGFDDFVNGIIERWQVPGMSVSIVKEGSVLFSRGFGHRDREAGLPVTDKTLFAIGSSTKAFTTMTLATLVDEGKLDWDTPVRHYLPWFEMHDPFATDRITPRDLVTHRSGLPRYDLLWYNNLTGTREELVRSLKYLAPSADFRTVFQYQNLMYLTAGYLAGELAGAEWETVVRRRILEPVGMNEANFSVEDSKGTHDFALPYSEKDGVVRQVDFRNIDLVGPAGSINANLDDMTRWLLLHLNRGKAGDREIVSAAQMDEMHRTQMFMPAPYLPMEENGHGTYGLGWFIESYNGETIIHHGGAIDGFLGVVAFMPKHQLGVVVQTNLGGTNTPFIVMYNVLDRLRGRDPSPVEARIRALHDETRSAMAKGKERSTADRVTGTEPSHDLGAYTGAFSHPGMGTITIGRDGAGLTYGYHGETFPLRHYHYEVFEFFEPLNDLRFTLNFRSTVRGDVDSLVTALEPAMPAMEFTRVADASMTTQEFLRPFVGEYELMGRVVPVTLENDRTLVLTLPAQPRRELEPHHGTSFTLKGMDGYILEFKTDAGGAVTGMEVVHPMGVFEAKKVAG